MLSPHNPLNPLQSLAFLRPYRLQLQAPPFFQYDLHLFHPLHTARSRAIHRPRTARHNLRTTGRLKPQRLKTRIRPRHHQRRVRDQAAQWNNDILKGIAQHEWGRKRKGIRIRQGDLPTGNPRHRPRTDHQLVKIRGFGHPSTHFSRKRILQPDKRLVRRDATRGLIHQSYDQPARLLSRYIRDLEAATKSRYHPGPVHTRIEDLKPCMSGRDKSPPLILVRIVPGKWIACMISRKTNKVAIRPPDQYPVIQLPRLHPHSRYLHRIIIARLAFHLKHPRPPASNPGSKTSTRPVNHQGSLYPRIDPHDLCPNDKGLPRRHLGQTAHAPQKAPSKMVAAPRTPSPPSCPS